MIPRVDPETRPSTTSVQVLKRRHLDKYGGEVGRLDCARTRPFETRNGLPESNYKWRKNDPERAEKIARERAERAEWAEKTSEKAAALR